jgi:hypothetical protein
VRRPASPSAERGNEQLDRAGCTFEGLRTVFQINIKFPLYKGVPVNLNYSINSEKRSEEKDQSGIFRSFFAWLGLAERNIQIVEHEEWVVPSLGEMLKAIYEKIAGEQNQEGQILRKSILEYITGNIRILGVN